MDGNISSSILAYYNMGWLRSVTRPVVGGTPGAATFVLRDNLGRPTAINEPSDTDAGGVRTSMTYWGRNRSISSGNHHRSFLLDAADRIYYSSAGAQAYYDYGPAGLLFYVRRAKEFGFPEIFTSLDYDVLGRPIWLDDPDAHTTLKSYNAFGELRELSRGTEESRVFYSYDRLGRETSRTDKDGNHDTYWDTAPGAGIGRIHQTVTATPSVDSIQRDLSYDGLSRLTSSTIFRNRADGSQDSFGMGFSYDSRGRLSRLRYAGCTRAARGSRWNSSMIPIRESSRG